MILYFHTAIYIGRLDKNVIAFIPDKIDYAMGTPVIWHASFIAGETTLWSVEKFCKYYKPVAAKRLSIT